LRSGKVNYWTGGEGRFFEQEFARACGVNHAVAVANGTVALELALHSLGIGPSDEVITPCRSYVASASCVAVRGATPVMADVDHDSQTITAQSIREVLTARSKAVIAVHLAGWPCDMDPILALAAERGLKVIEDCAQAQGATYHGRPVGSMGHVSAFSFCQDKVMTTGGEGGMMTTDDHAVWERAWSYRDHGRDFAAASSAEHLPGYRWIYHSLGTNWRMTEMQSALGRRGLDRVQAGVRRRKDHALRLSDALAAIPGLRTPLPPEHVGAAYYRFYTFVRPDHLREGWDRDRILTAIEAEGIPCFSGGCPEIYRERAFTSYRPPHRLKVAQELGETSLAFLVHPTLNDGDIDDTIAAIRKVMDQASIERDGCKAHRGEK
jgi:dTDP-4-amino-4,6-dideoxygalactose transaminase